MPPTPNDLPKTTETKPVETGEDESTPIHDELEKDLEAPAVKQPSEDDFSRFVADEDDDPTQFAGEFVEDEEND